MPAGWTLAQLQAKTANDLALVDGVQPITYQAMSASGGIVENYAGVNGFSLAEQYTSVFGLEVITRQWSLQRSQMVAVTRALVKDQIVDAAGATWVIYAGPESIDWDTQWRCQSIRQDCLLSVCGTTATLEQMTSTKGPTGGFTAEWGAVASNVQTRWQMINAPQDEPFGKKILEERWQVWSLQTPSVGQRWNLGNDANGLPLVYDVVNVKPRLIRSPFSPLFVESEAQRKRGMGQ